jgi:hypothetical protein
MRGMTPAARVPEDSPMRALLPAALVAGALLVIGIVSPLLAIAAVLLAMGATAVVAAYLVARIVAKFIRENSGPGGIFTAWRPTIGEGLAVALSVLVRWAPFGILSVLVFSANGLLVELLARLVEAGIESARVGVAAEADRLGTVDQSLHGVIGWFLPDALSDTITAARSGLQTAGDLLTHLLVLLRFLLVVESFVAWVFLIWLTVRSVLYFLARTVLAAQLSHDAADADDALEVRFDMEFTR